MGSASSSSGNESGATIRAASAEVVGTALVVLGGPGLLVFGGPDIGTLGVAIGFGASLAIAIGVLGAVANPMFSLALWFAKAISLKEAIADWIGQFVGGILGAAILWGLANTGGLTVGVNGWQPGDGVGAGVDLGITTGPFAELGVVIAAELVFGVILTVVLLSSIKEQRSNATTAAFVGGTATVATLFLLHVSGSGLNPARSLGMAIFADTDPNALGQVWAFIVVPVLAAVGGLMVWLAIDEATIDDTVFDDTVVESVVDAATDALS
ncbi:MAG TPA: aquaporin [Ilumatobacter sp.]|nr:aquaporin [Ilumatobacter sp.]